MWATAARVPFFFATVIYTYIHVKKSVEQLELEQRELEQLELEQRERESLSS